MKFFRTIVLSRIFCFLIVTQIFNLSVGIKDIAIECLSEDLSINDQETEVESMLEKVNLISHYSTKSFFTSQIIEVKPYINYLTTFHQRPIFDIFSPPPNA